nr:MAG TPA: hypothetical protein [Caudoviricetes sp.]
MGGSALDFFVLFALVLSSFVERLALRIKT